MPSPLLKETGRATGEVALSTHTHVYTRVKINQHTLPASTIPWHILPILSLRVEPIWFASDLEDAWLVQSLRPVGAPSISVGGALRRERGSLKSVGEIRKIEIPKYSLFWIW